MNDRAIAHLSPLIQPLCQQFFEQCQADGINAFITQTYRGEAEQNADYAKGRDQAGNVINKSQVVTNAKYGESPHNCVANDGSPAALAFDFAIKTDDGELDWDPEDDQWKKAIQIGEALGLVSGSTWHEPVDSPHFELANWKAEA